MLSSRLKQSTHGMSRRSIALRRRSSSAGSQKSSGSGAALFYTSAVVGVGCFYSAYKMENEPAFERMVEKWVPPASLYIFDSLREVMRSVGVTTKRQEAPRAYAKPSAPPPTAEMFSESDAEASPGGVGQAIEEDASIDAALPAVVHKTQVEVGSASQAPEAEPEVATEPEPMEVPVYNGVVQQEQVEQEEVDDSTTALVEATTQDDGTEGSSTTTYKLTAADDNSLLSETLRELIRAQGRRGIRDDMLEDLRSLSKEQLVMRLQALNVDYLQSSEAELAAVQDALRKKEAELETTYQALLQQQRAELEMMSMAAFRQKEQEVAQSAANSRHAVRATLENSKAEALRAQYMEFDNTWSAQLAKIKEETVKTFDEQRAVLLKTQEEDSRSLVNSMRNVEKEVGRELSAAAESIRTELEREHTAAACREAVAAVWQLEDKLKASEPLTEPLARLKAAASADPLTEAVLATIPTRVANEEDLRLRFRVVEQEVSRSAYAPRSEYVPIMVRLAVGEILSRMLFTPGKSSPAYLPPGESENDILGRVSYRLDHGDMEAALRETRRLGGLSRALMKDWEKSLADHVAAHQGAAVLKAKLTVSNRGFLE